MRRKPLSRIISTATIAICAWASIETIALAQAKAARPAAGVTKAAAAPAAPTTPATAQAISPEAQTLLQPKVRSWLEILEDRSRRVMGQQLADGRFLLFIKATISPKKFAQYVDAKNQNTQLTSLPMTLSNEEKEKIVAENITVEQIALVLGPITVDLTFDKDVPDEQAKTLKEAITSAIGLNTNNGDRVLIKKAPLLASTTSNKLENLSTKLAEGSKDVEKLRYEITTAQQKISQLQEQLQSRDDQLKSAQEKNKNLEDDLSIYKTPLGEVKKIVKGLELPLTILPIALLMFVFVAAGFFLYLRFQGTKTNKLVQAADVMAQAIAKANRGANSSGGGITLDAARAEFAKLTASQNEEAARTNSGQAPQALLGEELASARQEALDAWTDLKKYPYLTFAELREWLVGGGGQTQRFIAIVNALGPVESMRLLQQFSHDDLAMLRADSYENASKLPGYAALLQLHRNVTAEVIRRPQCIATLDFPEIIRASDEALAKALSKATPVGIALCINILPDARLNKILEALPPERQGECVDGIAQLDKLVEADLIVELGTLKNSITPLLASVSTPRLGAAEKMGILLKGSTQKTRATLQEHLNRHDELREKITQNMITFADVLAIENETLAELLDEFETEQIATLVCGIPEDAQQRIAKVLPRKSVTLVQVELQRLNSRQSLLRRAQAQSLEFQSLLAERLKALVDDGIIELKKNEQTA
jgi:flagellar motor switch protein FliG